MSRQEAKDRLCRAIQEYQWVESDDPDMNGPELHEGDLDNLWEAALRELRQLYQELRDER